jgi:hypothetical protein
VRGDNPASHQPRRKSLERVPRGERSGRNRDKKSPPGNMSNCRFGRVVEPTYGLQPSRTSKADEEVAAMSIDGCHLLLRRMVEAKRESP